MRLQSISGKLRQLRRSRSSLWIPFLAGWLRRRQTGDVPCLVPGGRSLLKVPLRDFLDSYAFFFEVPAGAREMNFFLSKLGAQEVIYDIGGFRGAYSAAAKTRLRDGGALHVFEPLAGNFEAIEQIRALNQFENFTIHQLAVSDGTAVSGHLNERELMLQARDSQDRSSGTQFPSVSLDEYIARGNPAPTIAKIDVEGFELQVLRGGRNCLAKHRPRLWLEIHPAALKAQGESADRVVELLHEGGYAVSYFDDYHLPTAGLAFHVWCE